MTQRIATSPLTGRIQIGRLNANNTVFVGQTRDVTSEVIGAIVEKARFHGGSFEIANRDFSEVLVITVTKKPKEDAS